MYSPTQIDTELSVNEMQTFTGRSCNKIIVLDKWDQCLQISNVQTSSHVMAVVYDLTYRWPSGATTHAFRIETRLKPVNRVGTLNEWIKFSTNHPDFTSIHIPIKYHICDSVKVAPNTLIFNNFLDERPAKTIRVHTAGKAPLEIEQIDVDDSWLSVKQVRIDPNTVDLRVFIPEHNEGSGHPLQSAITIRITRPEEVERTVPVVVVPRVACDDNRILSIIAMSNRFNSKVVGSFRCDYTFIHQDSGGMERKQIGQYAISSGREYHRIDAVGMRKDYLHYIRNGIHLRSSNTPHWAFLGTQGTADIRPPQRFWGASAGTGASVVLMLDRLNPLYDKVVSVEETMSDGRRLIKVGVEQRLAKTPPGECDNVLTIYFSVDDGFLPVRATSETVNKADRNRSFSYDAVVTRMLRYEIQDSTFYLPVEYREEIYRGGKLHRTRNRLMKDDSVEIDPDLPDELFRIDIQPGDHIIDKDLDMAIANPGIALDLFGSKVSFEGGRGEMGVKIIFGQELAQAWGPSLLGKSLPDWTGIVPGLTEEQTKDKIMLICFWDMDQRPSRNCITRIAEQAKQFESKGVITIAVQASEIEKGKLMQWVKENNISFPVGMIQGDEEGVRSDWAVCSLPWLILTDIEHVIRAEGFRLDELEDKIREFEGAQ
jgi:hypothetical protein